MKLARRPRVQRAWRKVEEGMVGVVNVKTNYRVRAVTVRFSGRETCAADTTRQKGHPMAPPSLTPHQRRDQRYSVGCSEATFQKSTRD